jgi:hypothetical protein
MKNKTIIAIIFIFVIIQLCFSQTQKVLLNELSFKSIFATSKNDSLHIYCLLGTGFLKTPHSDNSDSLITDWINKNQEALVIPISTFGPTETEKEEKNWLFTYCWLVAKYDTINNFLIRNGCYPGGTMMRPETWEEMSEEQKNYYIEHKIDKPDIIVHINKKKYEDFIEQIKIAQKYAEKNKLGIWSNKK